MIPDEESPQEVAPEQPRVEELPLAEHFRKNRVQEAENIRKEYVMKSTGRLPLPRSKSEDEAKPVPPQE